MGCLGQNRSNTVVFFLDFISCIYTVLVYTGTVFFIKHAGVSIDTPVCFSLPAQTPAAAQTVHR